MLESPWLIGSVAVLAGAIASVSGFGIGSLMRPLLMVSMPTAHAVAVLAVPHAVATTVRWIRLRADVHAPTFRQFGIASAVGGFAGAVLQSQSGEPRSYPCPRVAPGSSRQHGTRRGRRVPLPRTPVWRLTGGVLSGLFGGLVGNQGGIRAAALLGFQLGSRASSSRQPQHPRCWSTPRAADLLPLRRSSDQRTSPTGDCRRGWCHCWNLRGVYRC